MPNWAIRCDRLSKRYRIDTSDSYGLPALRRAVSGAARSVAGRLMTTSEEREDVGGRWIWALDDVSFELQQGDILGVIGPNGAGKSTMLKIMSRLTEPTRGRVEMRGRVGSLLEVGTGFHAELTGRENIFLNGAMLGMARADIRRRFDEIVEFSDVGEFIDMPVKHYSSGMYMRLAFSVAAHLESDILLIDEVLAVGDAAFQAKCIAKMEGVARSGRTIIFVSHGLDAVARLCGRAILIERGRAVADGQARQVVDTYLSRLHVALIAELKQQRAASETDAIAVTETWIENGRGERARIVLSGDRVKLFARYEAHGEIPPDMVLVASIETADGHCVLELRYPLDAEGTLPRRGRIEWTVPRFPLNTGRFVYNLKLEPASGDPAVLSDDDLPEKAVLATGTFDAEPGDFFGTGRLPPQNLLLVVDHAVAVTDDASGGVVLSCGSVPALVKDGVP